MIYKDTEYIRTLLIRFHRNYKINKKTECWEWKNFLDKDGYGFQGVMDENKIRKTVRAHRLSFFIANNYVPKLVMHTCDNPRCVNPKHLKAGNDYLNTLDMCKKGRQGNAKLTEAKVRRIRETWASGEYLQADLCKKFKLSPNQVHKIVKGLSWKHCVPDCVVMERITEDHTSYFYVLDRLIKGKRIQTRLTKEDVDKIRKTYREGKATKKELKERYKTTGSCMDRILSGKQFKNG